MNTCNNIGQHGLYVDDINVGHGRSEISPDGNYVLSIPVGIECVRLFNVTSQLSSTESDIHIVPQLHYPLRNVHDLSWYPLMNAYLPETCAFATTVARSPVQLWDAFCPHLRASYSALLQNSHELAYTRSITLTSTHLFLSACTNPNSQQCFIESVPLSHPGSFILGNFSLPMSISTIEMWNPESDTLVCGSRCGQLLLVDLRDNKVVKVQTANTEKDQGIVQIIPGLGSACWIAACVRRKRGSGAISGYDLRMNQKNVLWTIHRDCEQVWTQPMRIGVMYDENAGQVLLIGDENGIVQAAETENGNIIHSNVLQTHEKVCTSITTAKMYSGESHFRNIIATTCGTRTQKNDTIDQNLGLSWLELWMQ